ncbi:sensor histidine kinase [Desulfuromonas acetoxidans]|uniref:histidine kinase n=1 Tax=Desulfuromonas acetoxidans (strain DSM 684 / 11070) TaxID=281689 RepID=Q1JZK7_DESA6|nr:sensor histidine kinase [Desulfuromonas acetoxidans]EAT15560.1 GAF sensor signal transduction histidine kinase [Desulfuromonas acetoxidans DSM 684]MBF0646075.1 GAF domain-containing protein [Desulfuromonas acetoxidans]NVD25151.1 GAF domain-containing protein [Desulfuromonas acetoxidans]NVE17227.1 GAF domain-containing protein [Desulfuromonas acetoxidans]
MGNKEHLLQQLTGVDSSKLNYYVELKKKNEEILKQNTLLEILHQLTRDINIHMTIEDILDRTFLKLPQAIPCDFLSVATLSMERLSLKAAVPSDFCTMDELPKDSYSWQVIRSKKATSFDPATSYLAQMHRKDIYPIELKSLAIAPMFVRSEVIGVLLVASFNHDAYQEAELSAIQHLADHLSISIQNSRLYTQVSRAKQEWEQTFRAVTDPIVLVDLDYNVILHNGHLPEQMRKTWEQSNSNKCYACLHGLLEPCPDCPMEEMQKTLQPQHIRIHDESGLTLDRSHYPVLTDKGQMVAMTIILKDVTEKVKMEAQLVQSAKLAAIGEMAAGVAHELNSPMTVIIGTAQLLARELAEQNVSEEIDDIINCGLRCKRIIQNLLTFSRQDQIAVSSTDLNSEVERVLSLIQYQINRNQIRIIADLDPKLPTMTANGPQIQQVLTNLLVNARDALDSLNDEEKVIHVRTHVREKDGKRWAIISVEDNGCGIEEKDLQKIFTPFFTSKDATKGTGLGLSVSLGIAQGHNGTIEVKSTPGQGSTFSLVLPETEE